MTTEITRFVGIDLGGARGKTTAVAELVAEPGGVAVVAASTRDRQGQPWHDAAIWDYVRALPPGVVIAVHAPLSPPPCVRCVRPSCPGVEACDEPAVVWLRGPAERLGDATPTAGRLRFPPYLHRATEVYLREGRGIGAFTLTAAGSSQVASRAGQLRRRLAGLGYVVDDNLIEVSPVAAIAVWFGHRRARYYKHDGDRSRPPRGGAAPHPSRRTTPPRRRAGRGSRSAPASAGRGRSASSAVRAARSTLGAPPSTT